MVSEFLKSTKIFKFHNTNYIIRCSNYAKQRTQNLHPYFSFLCVVKLPSARDIARMNNNLKGEPDVIDNINIKPNYAVFDRKY